MVFRAPLHVSPLCSGQTQRSLQEHPGEVVGGLGVATEPLPKGDQPGMASFTTKGHHTLQQSTCLSWQVTLVCHIRVPWLMKPCVRHVTELLHDQRKDLQWSSDGYLLSSLYFVGNLLLMWDSSSGHTGGVSSEDDVLSLRH